MATKFEILEFLRISPHPVQRKVIIEELSARTGLRGAGIPDILKRLHRRGYLRKLWRKVEVSKIPGVEDRIIYTPVTKKRYRTPVYYELSEKALNLLKKHNVNSFYDIPTAKRYEQKMLSRGNPKWARGFVRFEE